MSNDTPGRPMMTIGGDTMIRTKLATLVIIASTCITGLVGGTLFFAKLSNYMDTSEKRLTRIEKVLGIDQDEARHWIQKDDYARP